jgi:hypothetical protein
LLSLYNEAYYLAQNPDVSTAVGRGIFADGLEHYLRFGQKEKRSPSSLFDEGDYLSVNPDVGQAVSAGIFSSGFAHYILHGRAENRLIFA